MSTFPVGAKVTGDTSGFVTAMAAGSASLNAFTGAAGLATAATGAFAVAIGAGIAVKSASEFQAELMKLNTLVGISAEQLDEWKGSILDISSATGKSAVDLTRALFAITSGGARGQEALDILTQSAQASAVGLGDMTGLGKTATAMLTAFGSQGLTAEKAIDILVATARDGSLEAESLAGAFSRVLGPAKELGATAEDVGAFIATYTRLGGSTEQAATGLLNVLNAMISPTKQAREAMDEYGIPLERIRDIVAREGLLAGLMEMKGALEGNKDAMGEVMPNVRQLIGFLSTVGLQAESYAVSQNNINDSLGLTSEGFIKWQETGEAAFAMFGAEAKILAIEIGENLLPPLLEVLEVLSLISRGLRMSIQAVENMIHLVAASPEVQGLMTIASALDLVSEEAEAATVELTAMNMGLSNMSQDQIKGVSEKLAKELEEELALIALIQERLGELDPRVHDEGHQTEITRLTEQLDRLLKSTGQTSKELKILNEAIDEGTVATGGNAEAEAESAENKQKRLDAIQAIVDSLALEERQLKMTSREILEYDLQQLRAEEGTLAAALASYERITALENEAEAEKRLAAAKIAFRLESQRNLEKQAQEDRRRARIDSEREQAEAMAVLEQEMREKEALANDISSSFADSFTNIIDGTESVADAFSDMVSDIIKELQRLAIQKGIIQPLTDILFEAFSGRVGLADSVTAGVGDLGDKLSGKGIGVFDSLGTSSVRADPSIRMPMLPTTGLIGREASPNQTIVQQTVNFSPQLIDGADGARWLQKNSGEIMGIIGRGAQQSSSYARSLRGGM